MQIPIIVILDFPIYHEVMSKASQALIEELLAKADIKINGDRPWDIVVHNQALYDKVLSQGSLGLGESYMQGWWECQQLDEFFYRIFASGLVQKLALSWPLFFGIIKARLFNLQAASRSFEVGQKHYDLGNDFFASMLGESMVYSCGYWSRPLSRSRPGSGKNTTDLQQAQVAKLDLICRKLNLQKGQHILDIGSGWGSFAKYAAEHYGVSVVGVTISKEQLVFAQNACQGLPVEFRLQDYRTLNEPFDHIVSVGMFEHVGSKNYTTYMQVVKRCLKKDGLFLLHTIGNSVSGQPADPWINKYIFPNGSLPSLQQITQSCERLFIIEDLHNFGADYDKTLMAWYNNFKAHWPTFKKTHGERFYKMWEYYLLAFTAPFRSRNIELWQIVLSPNGVKGGYKSIR